MASLATSAVSLEPSGSINARANRDGSFPSSEKRIETLSRPSSGTAMGEANTSSRRVASQTSSPSIFQTPSTPIVSPLSRVTTGA